MSANAQRFAAFILFLAIMFVFGKFWTWVVYEQMPDWLLKFNLFVYLPVGSVFAIIYTIRFKRKQRELAKSLPR